MKKIFASVLGLGLLACTSLQAAELKVGIVDVERLLRESKPAMEAEAKIQNAFAGREKQIKGLITQFKNAQTTYQRDAGSLSIQLRQQREQELSQMQLNLQQQQQAFSSDLNTRKNEELAVVMEQANRAIQRISNEENFDLILQEAVYRNPKLDITEKVIRYLSQGNTR